jgi:hypothetical protein
MSIIIAWQASNTVTAEEGGDVATIVAGELEIDAVVTEIHDSSVLVTEHPVEEGVNTSDHIRPNLDSISFECVVSNQPIRPITEGSGVSKADLALPPKTRIDQGANKTERSKTEVVQRTQAVQVLQFPAAFDRPREVYDQLNELMDSGTLIEVIGARFGDIKDWVIINISVPVDVLDGITFTLDIKEFRTATTEEVEAPSPRTERGRPASDEGTQDGAEEEGGENGRRSSAAFNGYNAIAERLGLNQLQSRQGS